MIVNYKYNNCISIDDIRKYFVSFVFVAIVKYQTAWNVLNIALDISLKGQ